MNAEPLTVVAVFRLQNGHEERFLQAARSVIRETRSEDGCITYELHRGLEDPSSFMFFERWRSSEDLELHLTSPHLMAFLSEVSDIRDGETQLTRWHSVP